MDNLKQLIDRLEWRVDSHEGQLKVLQQNAVALKDQLDAINKSLLQIKWFVVGGVICFLSEQLGLVSLIKLLGV